MRNQSILPLFICFTQAITTAVAKVDYQTEIAPIFSDRCIDCHGPEKQKSALRLDQRALLLRGGDSGLPSIVPGNADKSFLMEVVKGIDPDMAMPPKGAKLTTDQIKKLEQWINEGANWPGQMNSRFEQTIDLWSLQPVRRPALPPVPGKMDPVDIFLHEKLAEKKLSFNPPADPVSLIRRASIVLTGLPPTPERVTQFLADYANDIFAYERLVDELLDSPHFGERWAQHWLDVIRWAETNGSEANLYRKNAWIYRDYVVRSFNEDTPYDQFVREQLAGDQLGMGEATGFLVAGPHVPAATVGQEPSAIRQARADRMDEIMQTVGASMMGITISCARCHNHKFDPISIQDYYAMTAVFQDIEFGGRYPEYSADHPRKKRSGELYKQLWEHRHTLREDNGNWEEHWGAYKEFHFEPIKTKELRIQFVGGWGRIDELEILPHPKKGQENLALAQDGVKVTEGNNQHNGRARLEHINDGNYGTMAYAIKQIKGAPTKPWVRFEFPKQVEVGRLRLSSNREYYHDTDYIEGNKGKINLGDYRIELRDQSGSWVPVAGTHSAKRFQDNSTTKKEALAAVQNIISQLHEQGPRTSFIGRFIKPSKTYVLHRGSPENPRDEVKPAGFDILAGNLGLDHESRGPERRTRFAEWLTDPNHPLTARVMVNRVWHHVFGVGIVPTTADFGTAGAPPTHPDLLNWLTAEWVNPQENNVTPWSVKQLVRRLVLTEAFQQSSKPHPAGLAANASATLLWRFPPRRVEAEVLRDGILQASGKLDPTIGGKSYRIHNVKKTYAQWQVVNNHGEQTWRRMLYQERMRRVDDQIFTAFDFPDCGQVRAKRPISTTPLQALNLMNSPFAIAQAQFIAERANQDSAGGLDDAVHRAFLLLLNRAPTPGEKQASVAVARENGLHIVCRSIINSNEFAFLP